jgi:hypothetical protein
MYAAKVVPAGKGVIVITNNEEIALILKKNVIYDRFDQKK